MQILGHGEPVALPRETFLYGVAYRPIVRDGQLVNLEHLPHALAQHFPPPLGEGRVGAARTQ